MNSAPQFLPSEKRSHSTPAEQHHAAERRTDIQWGSPIFRAPSLPTPQQLSNELPFTVNFRGKSPRRA